MTNIIGKIDLVYGYINSLDINSVRGLKKHTFVILNVVGSKDFYFGKDTTSERTQKYVKVLMAPNRLFTIQSKSMFLEEVH